MRLIELFAAFTIGIELYIFWQLCSEAFQKMVDPMLGLTAQAEKIPEESGGGFSLIHICMNDLSSLSFLLKELFDALKFGIKLHIFWKLCSWTIRNIWWIICLNMRLTQEKSSKPRSSRVFYEKSSLMSLYQHFHILELAEIFRIHQCYVSKHISPCKHIQFTSLSILSHAKTSFPIQTSLAHIKGTADPNMAEIA
jgi:hypothetical protein